MLLLAMASLRSAGDMDAVRMMMRGQLVEGVQSGLAVLEHRPTEQTAARLAMLGQVVGRSLIHLGREEEAEELFRRQLRVYEMGSRTYVRWMSTLDSGALQLALNRLGRAAGAFNALADDEMAPVHLRIEALAGLAVCLRGLGEYGRAEHTLGFAHTLASANSTQSVLQLIEAIRLETAVMREVRAFDEGSDITMRSNGAPADAASLSTRLLRLARELDELPLASQRLRFLAALADRQERGSEYVGRISAMLSAMRHDRWTGYERDCGVEATLALVAQGEARAAHEVLGGMAQDEEGVRRHRHSLELKYCLSRIFAMQGRHADALRIYKEHVAQALARLHAELAHLPYSRCLEKLGMGTATDSVKMLLPLRYRRAYQYIVEHLDEGDLSVRKVAAHVDVTERSLQVAFRSYLGMTPAELIRRRRIEMISKELRESTEHRSVLNVAQRWGMNKRSTLAQNYRQFFNETPTARMRAGAPAGMEGPPPTDDMQ